MVFVLINNSKEIKMSDVKQHNGGDVVTIMLAAAAAVIAAWALIGYIAKIAS